MKFLHVFSFTLLLLLCIGWHPANAQFQAIFIGVNGLTCSQCSRTVEISIRKLDFVADVQMNLEHTEGKIILKNGKKADMEKIAQAVTDAGFSLRYLKADFAVDNSVKANDECFSYKGDQYIFITPPKQVLSGTVQVSFIGKKYMAAKDFKKMQQYMTATCGTASGKVYHVSL